MPASRFQPALMGGLLIGVLSSLPLISAGNACCCLWVVSGGALAAWLLQQNQQEPIGGADGALVGLMAGGIGAVISTVISIPVQMFFGPLQRDWFERVMRDQDFPPELFQMLEPQIGVAAVLASLIFSLIIFSIFGLLGGLLGVALFRRKSPPIAQG